MATRDLTERHQLKAVDARHRDGSIGMILLIVLLLVGVAVGLLLVGRGHAENYILAVLVALAVIGVVALFAGAAGILRISGKRAADPMLAAVVEGAYDGIAITDPAGRVVYGNTTYRALTGAADERDLKPVERVFVGDPDVSEAVYRLIKAAREGRRLQEELRVPGLRDEPARWLRLRVRPLGETAGHARSTVWSVDDITRDRERQENIFQELQHAIDYLDHAPAGFFSVDAAGDVVYLNATLAAWLDHDLAQVGSGGLKLTDIVLAEGAALLAGFPAAPGEVKTEVLDRSARFFVAAVEEGEREGEAVIIYAIETTDQRALEAQMNQAQKMDMVGQLAGGIAHDFNNVLSAIMMATDFLLNAHRPTDPSFQDIIQIKQNTNRAASLVRQLLAFSRRQTMRPQVLDLGEVLADLKILLQRLLGEKVSLDPIHSRDLWPVKADLSQFEQVIINLAVNARDAMPDGGKLMIRTANVAASECALFRHQGMPAADYVLIEVSDTGSGIPPEIMDKIFEPFFSTKEVGKGTGLGLSTVYGIVKQSEGFIFLESELGKGTTFRIFLPRHVPGAEAVEPEQNVSAPALVPNTELPQPAVDLTGHGTILLVEDEDGLRGLNARGLSSRGYTVLEASNGVDAIQVLEERKGEVDLVVSDVVMPEMDGPTLLKEMRKRNPGLKMIFVSGYAEDAFGKNLPEGGQFAFLAKPFTLKQLIAAVKDTIGR